MSFRYVCKILIIILAITSAKSEEMLDKKTSYVHGGLQNISSCNIKLNAKSLPKECQSSERYDFVMTAGENGTLTSLPTMSETDELELLCYRCVLKKVEKSSCGRYANIWDKPSKISKCPEFE